MPLPNVSAQIDPSRWVNVSPGAGGDTARIQAAINSVAAMTPDANGWRGVVYLNPGEYQVGTTGSPGSVSVTNGGSGYSSAPSVTITGGGGSGATATATVSAGKVSVVNVTTRNLTQPLVPAGTRTFQVDSTSGLAVGHSVIVKRPSTALWLADIDMDQLGPGSPGGAADDVPWTPGSKDL